MAKKKLKVAFMSCTHGHARGYYGLIGSELFDVVAASVPMNYRDRVFIERLDRVDLYEDDEAMLDVHHEIEAVIMYSGNCEHAR